jgi:hypothetical protein
MAQPPKVGSNQATSPFSDTAAPRKISDQEKAAVKALLEEIDHAKTLTKEFNETTLPKLRKLQSGAYGADPNRSDVRTNLIFATAATLLPHTYAKNPEIAVSPAESVDTDGPEYEQIGKFCQAAQIAVNKLLVEEAKLKLRAKSAIRSAMTTSVGWFKLSFQHSLTHGDPVILRRHNDMQENLRTIEWLIKSADATTDIQALHLKREELRQHMAGIAQSPEIKIFKGFTLDRVPTENMFILDDSITEFDEYVDAKKLAQRIWVQDDTFEQSFGFKCPASATSYKAPAADSTAANSTQGENPARGFRAIYEVWDKTTNLISVVCEGFDGYVRAPAPATNAPERWYPYYCIAFNLLEGRWRPLSDIELLEKLQEEYNTTRYLFAETRKEAIPVRAFRKSGGLTPEDIDKLSKRQAGDFIGIEGSPTVPLKDELVQFPGVAIDPAAYDVTIIRNDMDMMVGLSDASRSNLIEAKTATEAEIMKQALMTRVAERQDTCEDTIGDMATAVLQTSLMSFTKDEIGQLCGKGAAEVWPEGAGREDVFRKVRVKVKAGTSGKPNIMKERESWAAIMPIIQKTMEQVAVLRERGQYDLADSSIELLKETLQRYDEKIDVERFIPRQEMDEQGNPINNAQMQQAQQMEQMQLQFEECQKQLQQCQQELQQCQQDLQMAKYAQDARIAEANAKAEMDVARENAARAREEQLAEQRHQREMMAMQDKEAREREAVARAHEMMMAETNAKGGAEVEKIRAQENVDKMKMESDERIKMRDAEAREYAAIVAAAGKIVEAKLAPKPTAEGEKPSKDKAAQAGAADVSKMMSDAVSSINEMAKAIVKSRASPMRVVTGANGLPERLVPEGDA